MATRAVPKAQKRISPIEAYRALYVDFEGFADKTPSLIGIACEYDFEQVVLDDGLAPAAEEKGLNVRPVESVGQELLDRSQAEDRVIVGYSQAESQQFREFAGVDVSKCYRDARMIGRRWINRLHRGEVSEWRLKSLLEYLGHEPSRHLGDGVVTKRLRDVLRGLEVNEGSYDRLTPTQKRKWTNLLEYNRIDCVGMRDLVMRAAAEIAVDEA